MITRSPRRQSFTIVDNEILDSGLPLDTIGLFIYLLSKPDNWQVNVGHLKTKHNVGKNRVYRMLGELQDAGYATYERHNSGHTDWIISETRIDTPHPQNGDKPHPQKPDQEKPDVAKPDVANGDVLTTPERTTKTEKELKTEKATSRGTRLPAGWVMSDEDLEFILKTRPDLNPEAVESKFRDYWISKPGQAGLKLSWPATWRNWVRNEKQVQEPRSVESKNAETLRRLMANG